MSEHELLPLLKKLVELHNSLPSEYITAKEASDQGFGQHYTNAIAIKRAGVRFMAKIGTLISSEHATNCLKEMPRSNIHDTAELSNNASELLDKVLANIRIQHGTPVEQDWWTSQRFLFIELIEKLKGGLEPALSRFFAISNSVNAVANLTLEIKAARETIAQMATDSQKAKEEREKQEAVLALTNYIKDCRDAIGEHVLSGRIALTAFLLLLFLLNYIVFWLLSSSPLFGYGPLPPSSPSGDNGWQYAIYIFSKIMVVGVAAVPCLIACRLYLTHQHNIVSLRHQKLAFQALVDLQKSLPSEDKEIRAKVTEQCVQAICSREASGFLKADADVTAYSSLVEKVLQVVGKN